MSHTNSTPKPEASMSDHAPGPWVYREYGGMCGTNIFVVERPSHEPICTLPDNRYNGFSGEANARLIAAAPEMLEALEKIISSWERERLHSNQGNNHAQDEAELEKNYQIALAKLMICEKIKAAK